MASGDLRWDCVVDYDIFMSKCDSKAQIFAAALGDSLCHHWHPFHSPDPGLKILSTKLNNTHIPKFDFFHCMLTLIEFCFCGFVQKYQHKFLDSLFSGLSCVVSVPFYTGFLPLVFWVCFLFHLFVLRLDLCSCCDLNSFFFFVLL